MDENKTLLATILRDLVNNRNRTVTVLLTSGDKYRVTRVGEPDGVPMVIKASAGGSGDLTLYVDVNEIVGVLDVTDAVL